VTKIVDFSKAKKKDKPFKDKSKHKVNSKTYALSLIKLLEHYSDHFWNNYQLSEQVNENIADAFSEKVKEIKSCLNLNLRYIASRKFAEVLHQGPSSISEIVHTLKQLHKYDILPFEEWFTEIGIPIESTRIIRLSDYLEEK